MKFLVIQTAFIGDVVLATPLVEKLHRFFPDAQIDFLLRKGNEQLLQGHPNIQNLWVWDKKKAKYWNWWKLLQRIRAERYDWVINCQRFAAAGLFTVWAGSRKTVGFKKNPFSSFFSHRVPHVFGTDDQRIHEVDRNLGLIGHLTDRSFQKPRLYPSGADVEKAQALAPQDGWYCCLAPTSVWQTKQYPLSGWVGLVDRIPDRYTVFLLGGPTDAEACREIQRRTIHPQVQVLAGQLSFLESAALMRNARMNYVNDSAPLHFASAVDAPVTAIFCSTVPRFGFFPLSTVSHIVQTTRALPCRPCGLHGRASCPEGHFNCAQSILADQIPLPE